MSPRVINDPDTQARARRLRRMMQEFLANQTPQERDRMMQLQLAQARGPVRNGDLLRAAVARAVATIASHDGSEIPIDDPLIDTLTTITSVFDKLRIAHALSGSLAASIHGEPFSSREVEFFVDESLEGRRELLNALSPRFVDVDPGVYGQIGTPRLRDNHTFLEIMLVPVQDDPFLRGSIPRRHPIRIGSDTNEFSILRVEDVILSELKIHRQTLSAKRWENALSLAKFKEAGMDWRHLFEQATVLTLTGDLVRLRDEASM